MISKVYELGDLCEIRSSKRIYAKDYVEEGIPFYRSKEIIQKYNHENISNELFITEELYNKIKEKYSVPISGDILLTSVGTLGIPYMVRDKDEFYFKDGNLTWFSNFDEKLNNRFLYYWFTSDAGRSEIERVTIGSTQKALTIVNLKKINIQLPSLDIQNNIVKVLDSLNLKFINNLSIIRNLEELSQTLFKHWFIDFEFPNEGGFRYKSSGGKMFESELGEIPESWSVEYLSSSTEFLSGGTPKTKEPSYWNGDIPFFTPKDVGISPYSTITEKTITELGLSKCNSKLYPKNTVFITARGTVGKVALANRDMAMNQSCFALKSKYNTQLFLYGVIHMLLREIIQGANGAVFNAINLNDLNRLQLKMPPIDLIRRYEEVVKPLFNQMSELEIENIKLQELLNTLLPKLLSGEIEIPEEIVVG